jgi:hypothetical protein
VITLLEHDEPRLADRMSLEAQRRELSRSVLSLVCQTTGRRRSPEERARLAALVREIDRVRGELRRAGPHA